MRQRIHLGVLRKDADKFHSKWVRGPLIEGGQPVEKYYNKPEWWLASDGRELAKRDGFVVLQVESVKNAVDQIVDEKNCPHGDCIKRLIVWGHARVGVGPLLGSAVGLAQHEKDRRLKSDQNFDLLDPIKKNKKFCPECVIEFHGCEVGFGQTGQAFLQKIADCALSQNLGR